MQQQHILHTDSSVSVYLLAVACPYTCSADLVRQDQIHWHDSIQKEISV